MRKQVDAVQKVQMRRKRRKQNEPGYVLIVSDILNLGLNK